MEEKRITPEWIQSSKFEVEIAGKRFPAKVNVRSPRLPAVVPFDHPEIAKYATTQDDQACVRKFVTKMGVEM